MNVKPEAHWITGKKIESFRKEQELFHIRWVDILSKGDPYLSSHLTLKEEDFFSFERRRGKKGL
jgi:hypothetical protein